MTIDEIADLLLSSEAELLPAGNYVNRRGVDGGSTTATSQLRPLDIPGTYPSCRRSYSTPTGSKLRYVPAPRRIEPISKAAKEDEGEPFLGRDVN
jgi:hypothetical protein